MSTKHSPRRTNIVHSYASSQPDLSRIESTDSIMIRKRKQPDNESEIKEAISEFRNEIRLLFEEFKTIQLDEFKKMRSDVADIKTQFLSIRKITDSLTQEHNQIKQNLRSITDSLEYTQNEHEDLKGHVNQVTADLLKLKTVELDLTSVRSQVTRIQADINLTQQQERLTNLEITGIPEEVNENVIEILMSISRAVGITTSKDNIMHIHRVPTRVPGKPKNIVVKFKSLIAKDTLISAVRRRKVISTADIGMPGEAKPFFVNEHLSPYYKDLHKKSKVAARAAGYKYVWIRNCKIFVRKSETSPSFIIKDSDDLGRIK